MTTATVPATAAELDLARECLYRLLSAAVSDPRGGVWPLLHDDDCRAAACASTAALRDGAERTSLGLGELPAERLDDAALFAALPESEADLCDEHARVFGLLFARECPPYETEYYSAGEAFFRSQQMADVAGFYRAFGVTPSARRPERPDHLALELEFMALLLTKKRLAATDEEAVRCAETEAAFFRDHLAWWLPAFASGLRRKAGQGFYALVGEVLAAFVPLERARFGVPAQRLPLPSSADAVPEDETACAGCAPA